VVTEGRRRRQGKRKNAMIGVLTLLVAASGLVARLVWNLRSAAEGLVSFEPFYRHGPRVRVDYVKLTREGVRHLLAGDSCIAVEVPAVMETPLLAALREAIPAAPDLSTVPTVSAAVFLRVTNIDSSGVVDSIVALNRPDLWHGELRPGAAIGFPTRIYDLRDSVVGRDAMPESMVIYSGRARATLRIRGMATVFSRKIDRCGSSIGFGYPR